MLEVNDLNVYYGAIHALKGVSFNVEKGEIVTLIGANGAGKSTTLSTISGLLRSRTGSINFLGEDIARIEPQDIVRRSVIQVPEGRRIFPGMTVEENLLIGTVSIGTAHLEQDREAMFSLFPRLKERRNQRAGTMSGGEQQMLAIARALMSRPEMVLLDEPSLGLAPKMIANVFAALKQIAAAGKTIFLVEQNANQALALAHRGYVLVNGAVRMEGTGAELLANEEIKKVYLGGH